MGAWVSGHITANGLRLHYTRTGGEKPVLVLAHGFSDDGLCWSPVAEVLAADYDVVMVDARGHGRSEGPESGYGPIDLGDDLAEAIKALGLEKPYILGHSMGAVTILSLASRYPDLPKAILLEDPPAGWSQQAPPTGDDWLARMRSWIVAIKRSTREELIAGERERSPHWSEAEIGPWADSKLRLSFNVLNRAHAEALDWHTLLPQIQVPTLLIYADPALGGIIGPQTAAEFKALVKHADLVQIDQAGHSIRRDQFQRYRATVQAWLKQAAA
jgi:pimeloyl-ACP methyl ester carboxylesterase